MRNRRRAVPIQPMRPVEGAAHMSSVLIEFDARFNLAFTDHFDMPHEVKHRLQKLRNDMTSLRELLEWIGKRESL